ncbi:MAG: YihY family inner membrane protein [Candidatus Polarisedimenticolaceae bacterium]|nr:YihY family inner membrane protein [Candidatus Polarisedimenticolaceae bacterium]
MKFSLTSLRRFICMVFTHFSRDGGTQNAAALTYTTLLSLVPLMTVMLALLAILPISERVTDEINSFLFNNFVPAAGEVVQQHLQTFSSKAGRLSGFGFIFLVVVALMLMATIERAFSTIWHLQSKRSLLNTILVYSAILLLGPGLIVGSVAATSYLVSLPYISDAAQTFNFAWVLMPLFVSTLAFTLLYSVVPNQRVLFKDALVGGVVAALLFEGAKRGFALYLTHFPTYEVIYGALAAVPIFLVWIYLSWLVTLLGAEVTYCLSIYHDDWHPQHDQQRGRLLLAYRLLGRLWQAQQQEVVLTSHLLGREEQGVSDEEIESLMAQLQDGALVLKTNGNGWQLACDLTKVSLFDLYRSGPFVLPTTADEQALSALLMGAERSLRGSMSTPLAQLYHSASVLR